MKLRTPVSWPAGTTAALALTFDLDGPTMWTSRDPRNADRPSVMSQGAYDVGEGLVSVLDFLDANGIGSTFFVPSDVALGSPEAVREIVHRGHEVACHGTDHVPVDVDITRAQQSEMLRQATEALEDVTQVRPVGYRAPMYSVTPDTWGILRDLGYEYSSNLTDSIHPYRHEEGLVEVPVHWSLDDGVYFLVSYNPPNYRVPRTSADVAEIWTEELVAIAQLGGMMTLTLHPQLIGRPSRLRVLQDVVDAAMSQGGVWFPRLADLSHHVADDSAGRTDTLRR